MAITNNDLGCAPSGKSRLEVEHLVPRRDLELLLGALMKHFSPTEIVTLSRESVEDAPDIEIGLAFETDEFQMRVRD